MIAKKDPLALALLKQYNNLQMPNLRLNRQEAIDLIDYMKTLSAPTITAASTSVKPAGHDKELDNKAAPGSDIVAVMNAWVREAHPGASVNAGYMTLINVGKENLTLASVKSADFDVVEFHEMGMDDGMMQMRELKTLEITPGAQVKLAPGGKHLMLKKPKRTLVDGDNVELVLHFTTGDTQVITMAVIKS